MLIGQFTLDVGVFNQPGRRDGLYSSGKYCVGIVVPAEFIIDNSESIGVVPDKLPEAGFCRIKVSLLEIGPPFLVYLLLFRRHMAGRLLQIENSVNSLTGTRI